MNKKQLSMTTAMAAAILALPACSTGDDWNEDAYADADTSVCVNDQGQRVEDRNCNETGYRTGRFMNYYVGRGSPLPYYGDSVYDSRFSGHGSFQPRQGGWYSPAPASSKITRSQAVSRGGVGSTGRSFGGGRS